MHSPSGLIFIILAMICGVTTAASQQSSKPATGSDEQAEAIHLQGELVEVPVIVRDRQDRYIADLKKEDFTIYENGIEQPIALLAHTEEPFHVALLLDTSGSTKAELPRIQQAALTFLQQLHPRDEVMIVSFDDEVRVENEFTSDRRVLSDAIHHLRPGKSTHLYDAVYVVVAQRMSQVSGRKAMILFTDGVDTASREASDTETLRQLEESNVLVYSIRYDTREAVRRRLRSPKTINIGNVPIPIPSPPSGPTARNPNPPRRRQPQQWPSPTPSPNPWPSPTPYPNPNPYPSPTPYPNPNPYPRRSPYPAPTPAPSPAPGPTRTPRRHPAPNPNDPLELEYERGERYLWELADRTGGVYYEANLLRDLPGVFERIAEELRHQYTLGYYPTHTRRDGHYRRIKVRVARSGAYVRARPGYRVR